MKSLRMSWYYRLEKCFSTLLTYMAQMMFDKNCAAHYLVSIGNAFIGINK